MNYANIINEPLEKQNKFINKLDYVMIFLLIYVSSSFYMATLPGMLILGIQYGCIFIIFIMSMLNGREISINSNMAIKMLTLVVIIGMGSMSARGDETKQTIINISYILISYLYALNYDFNDFIRKFANVIYFLCYFSIIVYFIYMIVPDVVELLPDVYNTNNIKAENALFSTIYGGVNARNQSIFWEPGAFQTYIVLALLIEMFYLNGISKKRMIIYATTMLTTFSTAGYITALFVVYTYVTQLLFISSDENKKSTRNIFFVLTLVIILVIVFLSLNSGVADHVFGKFDDYRRLGAHPTKTTTASVRFDAFIKPFKVFWHYPMFGAGTRGMTNFAYGERYNMNTCTFINWFAYFGIFFGAMMMQMYYKFAKRFSNNKIVVFMIFFALFLATATENYYRNPSILIFAFFPLNEKGETKKNEQNT